VVVRAAVLLLVAVLVAAPWQRPAEPEAPALHADGLVLGEGGAPLPVAAGSGLRRLAGAPATDPALPGAAAPAAALARGRAWLAAGGVPGAGGPHEDMARTALLDLDLLVLPGGAAVAGWSPRWRYAWPRDASHVAAALAVTGRHERALEVLEHLQAVQARDGTFAARYRPDRSGAVPDDRGVQLDGTGWVLWATWVWAATAPPGERAAGLARLRPLVVRSAGAAVGALDPATGLPPVSPDYWETPVAVPTLGTAAPWQAGLRAAVPLLRDLGERRLADAAADGARRLAAGVRERFGAVGYARRLTGGPRDTAVAWLLPPYAPARDDDVVAAWQSAAAEMARSNGGLAPGGSWRQDGIAWTPETAAFALTAAATGRRAEAEARLAWLDAHRTPLGSLPEKVGPDGRPASVAPLAWTGALVLLALAELDGAGAPVPPVPPAPPVPPVP
jgi:GH15 family glucan-1,4-alpha-glucosidase